MMENFSESDINIDLDLSTEITHSVLDILEEIGSLLTETSDFHYEGLILLFMIF